MSLSKWLKKEKALLETDQYKPIVLDALKLQVCKDFNIGEEQLQEVTYESILTLIEKQLRPLWQEQDEKLMHLLYRIDVSEPKVRQGLQNQSTQGQIKELTKIVISRELEKVITRLYFSDKLS